MRKKRTWLYLGIVASLLAAGLLAATLSGVAGQDSTPESRPEKLDAVLGYLLAHQESRIEPAAPYDIGAAFGRSDRLGPLHVGDGGTVYVGALVVTNDGSIDGLEELGVLVGGVLGDVVVARIPVTSLGAVTALPSVEFAEAVERLSPLTNLSVPETGAPIFRNDTGLDGSGVIVGVIDSGVDFTHPDFLNPDGTTRILLLCDQTTPPGGGQTCPGGGGDPNGGTLWTADDINASMASGGPVTQRDRSGHGSGVLGVAAGNGEVFTGMAPGAPIIMIKTSFFTSDIVNGMGFIDQRATAMGLPYVINLSLGSDTGPHDGSDALSQAIDDLVGSGVPGKAVVVAAGNSGNDKIHLGGTVTPGGSSEVAFDVPQGVTTVFLDIWYEGQDTFTVDLSRPSGGQVNGVPQSTSNVDCFPAPGGCYGVHHSPPLEMNGDVQVFVQLEPNQGSNTVEAGTWRVTLNGASVSDGSFHAWISCLGNSCDFPSGDSLLTVGEPAVARDAIAVASYVTRWCWAAIDNNVWCFDIPVPNPEVGFISGFSAVGPTRDGRQKPDIAAPGQGIASARSVDAGFSDQDVINPDGIHAVVQGTSFAAPHVSGAVALLLAQDPTLDADQIKALLQNNALKDGFTGAQCNVTWGCGKLDISGLGVHGPRTIVVTKEEDTDGACLSDDCSLREAIAAADPGDTVQVPPGTYTLTQGTELVIDKDLTVEGAGAEETIIEAAALPGLANFRIMNITSGNVVVSEMTVRNGFDSSGGGFRNEGTLSVHNSRISGNLSANGGGIFNSGGSVTITGSTFIGNIASAPGGGIWNRGTLMVTNSTFDGNQAQVGGGIFAFEGSVTITNSTFTANSATSPFVDAGGGINITGGSVTLINSTVDGNTSEDDGAGIFNSGTLTVTNSTLSNNRTNRFGGGIRNDADGSLTVTNSTISGNTAVARGGGISNAGQSSVNYSTVTDNTAGLPVIGNGIGGGISNNAGSTTLIGSIVSGNSASSDPDCSGTINSRGYNIAGCPLTLIPVAPADVGSVDPLLGPLQDNGGPTLTHALLPGSPAVDAVDPADLDNACPDTDQPGVARPQGSACDIGAFELEGPVGTLTVDSVGDGGDTDPGDGTCDDGNGNCTLRAAIEEANALPGTQTVAFGILGDGPHTIQPQSGLPAITDPTIIDGYTQLGASPNNKGPDQRTNAVLVVELDGSNAGENFVHGLLINAPDSVVRGLAINRFSGNGIAIFGAGATGNRVEGNFLGTNVTGTLDRGNLTDGVQVRGASNNTIGGTAPEDRNLISGNEARGASILGEADQDGHDATGNVVLGNLIGTNVDGISALGNTQEGVVLRGARGNTVGGTEPGAGNVISGNRGQREPGAGQLPGPGRRRHLRPGQYE